MMLTDPLGTTSIRNAEPRIKAIPTSGCASAASTSTLFGWPFQVTVAT
jgi:hypothetical protein